MRNRERDLQRREKNECIYWFMLKNKKTWKSVWDRNNCMRHIIRSLAHGGNLDFPSIDRRHHFSVRCEVSCSFPASSRVKYSPFLLFVMCFTLSFSLLKPVQGVRDTVPTWVVHFDCTRRTRLHVSGISLDFFPIPPPPLVYKKFII